MTNDFISSGLNTTSAEDQVQIEAASWIAQLDNGKLSALDKLALAEWMARSPRHKQVLTHLTKIWGGIDLVFDDVIIPETKVSFWRVVRSWIWVRPAHFITSVTASLAMLLLVSFVVTANLKTQLPENFQVYQAAKGNNASHDLSDGSILHLNTDTLVEVKFTKNTRILRLLRGEAYFEVAKDSSRPFHVYAGESRVAAIGTAFSVKLHGERVDVIVREGKVRFDRVEDINGKSLVEVEKSVKIDTPVFMEAGQSMEFEESIQKVVQVDETFLDKNLAWQRGEMIFSGESLETVVDEMNRYSAKTIVISDRDLRSELVSGTFKSDDIPAILDAFEFTMGISVDENDRKVYLSR